jgi:hypothetical protein
VSAPKINSERIVVSPCFSTSKMSDCFPSTEKPLNQMLARSRFWKKGFPEAL